MSWSWKDAYSQKIRSASDAAALINSGDHVTIAMASSASSRAALVSPRASATSACAARARALAGGAGVRLVGKADDAGADADGRPVHGDCIPSGERP